MNNNRVEQSEKYSYIGMFSNSNYVYAMQYSKSFNILYSANESIDTIALPMLYSLRHYLELILKANISYFQEFSELTDMVDSGDHKLFPLLHAFKKHWKKAIERFNIDIEDLEYFKNLHKLLEIINLLDKNSMGFRYAYTKKTDENDSKKHFEWMKTIDILEIKNLFDKVTPLLNHSIDVFDDQTGLMHGTTKEELLNKKIIETGMKITGKQQGYEKKLFKINES